MKISVIVPTCSPDFPLLHPEFSGESVLSFVASQIDEQDFDRKEVEVLIIDPLADDRGVDILPVGYATSPVRHINPDRDLRSWAIENRRTNHCALRNAGLLHATGEMIFLVDDTIVFDDVDLLTRLWEEHQRGNAVSPLVHWKYGEETDHPDQPDWRWAFLTNEKNVNRWSTADEPNGYAQPIGFGIISYPLEAALRINGYDEMMDAGTQLADTSFAARLAASGTPVVIDRNIHVSHQAHTVADPRIIETYNRLTGAASTFVKATHCNRAYWAASKSEMMDNIKIIANQQPVSIEVAETLMNCPWYDIGRCSLSNTNCEVPHLARQGSGRGSMRLALDLTDQLNHQRIFNLREERKQLHG